MKISKYNHVIPYDAQYMLIFNGRTGVFIFLDKNAQKLYKQISEGKTPVLDYADADVDLKKLRDRKIIIEDDVDELEYIKVMNRIAMFQTNVLSITLAPTLNCNFRCSYCYENKSKIKMTRKTQEQIIDFIGKQLKSISTLNVCWYGGEPLLEKQTIWNLSEKLIALCKKNGCKYSSSMVTNGYFLDKKTALKLKHYGISHIQITVDGQKNDHDAKRVLVNGKGTFDQIMKNVVDAVDVFPFITIRVNIDKKNVNSASKLLDVLTNLGLKNKIQLYYAMISSDTKACQDIAENCLAPEQYSQFETKLFKQTIEKGFMMIKYPRPLFSCCGAVCKNSLVIDPKGDIYKCWNDVGINEEKIGHITHSLEYNSNHLKWLSWDPLSYEKCRACTLLPVCMGGCPSRTLRSNLNEPECRDWKYNVEDMLRLYYRSFLQQKNKKQNAAEVHR